MTILTGINFLVALGNTAFLYIMGVDYALLWGLLSWFMGYIPTIGFWIALIPPVLMAYAQYGLRTAMIVFVGFVVINSGIELLVKPRVAGKGLKISPLVIFVGLFFWGFLLGGIGAILSVPLTLLVITIMEQFPATRPISTLLRYTGEEKKEERKEAMLQVKDLWAKTRALLHLQLESRCEGSQMSQTKSISISKSTKRRKKMYPVLVIAIGLIVLVLGKRLSILGAAVGALLGVALVLSLLRRFGPIHAHRAPLLLGVIGFFAVSFAKGIINIVMPGTWRASRCSHRTGIPGTFHASAGSASMVLYGRRAGVIGFILTNRFKDWAVLILAGLIGGLLVTRGLAVWLPFLSGAVGTLLTLALAGLGVAYQGGYL